MTETRFPAILPVDREGLLARVRLTAYAAGYFLAAFPTLVLFCLVVTSLGLTPVVLGGVLLLGLVPVVATLAGAHRSVTGVLLGEHINGSYADTTGSDPVRRLQIWAKDQTRWRDFAFLAFASTGGMALTFVVVVAAAAPFAHVLMPFIFGGGWSWLFWLLVPLDASLWWILTPILFRTRLIAESRILGVSRTEELQRRVEDVTAARAETMDHSAAELRRIERDLHDGAQARMVSLGMNLGLAEELLKTDPQAAAALLEEARATTLSVLDDLRTVMRGILPPVLADRGLVGAVEALALDVALPVTVTAALPGRAPAPVESAVYFAVAECLANVVKHSEAGHAWVALGHRDGMLSVVVGDDGVGGADFGCGTGLRGVARRLETFDGRTALDSPVGGPTTVTMELPCELSSPKTSPSSGTA